VAQRHQSDVCLATSWRNLGASWHQWQGQPCDSRIRLPWHCPKPYEEHHRTTGQTHSDSLAFQLWSHKLMPEVRTNQATHSHIYSHQKLLQFCLPHLLEKSPTCGIPFGDSWELIRHPLHPVGQDMTESWLPRWGLTMSGWNCQASWSTSLWSPVGSRLLRGLELQGEGGPWILVGGMPPCLVPRPSLLWCSPVTFLGLKGPEQLESCWGLLKCCGNIVRWETK
jgi:hypothetical protein